MLFTEFKTTAKSVPAMLFTIGTFMSLSTFQSQTPKPSETRRDAKNLKTNFNDLVFTCSLPC